MLAKSNEFLLKNSYSKFVENQKTFKIKEIVKKYDFLKMFRIFKKKVRKMKSFENSLK